jgi:hypothetical protein
LTAERMTEAEALELEGRMATLEGRLLRIEAFLLRVNEARDHRACSECGRADDGSERGWKAYLTDDEPAETVLFCPECAEREFGEAARD